MNEELKKLFFAYLHGYADASRITQDEIIIPRIHLSKTQFFHRYCQNWDNATGMQWLKEWLKERNNE